LNFTLDGATLLALSAALSVATALVLLVHRGASRPLGACCWLAAVASCSIAWLLWWPGQEHAWHQVSSPLGHVFVLLALSFVVKALYGLADRSPPRRLIAALCLLTLGAALALPGKDGAMAAANAGAALLFVAASWPLLAPLKDIPDGLRRLTAAVLLSAAAGLLVRVGLILLAPGEFADLHSNTRINTFLLMLTLATLVAATLGYILMLQARATARYVALARLDPLTGVLNTAGLQERFEAMLDDAERAGRPYSLLLVDVLDLSGINAREGHLAGDHALRELGQRIQQALPRAEVARVGADKFLAVLAGPIEEARIASEQLEHSVGLGAVSFDLAFGMVAGQVGVQDPLRLAQQAQAQLALNKRRRRRQSETGREGADVS